MSGGGCMGLWSKGGKVECDDGEGKMVVRGLRWPCGTENDWI